MRTLPAVMLVLGLGFGSGAAVAEEKLEVGVLKLPYDSVRRVQEMLTARGYPVKEVDGRMGDETRGAIKAFQKGIAFKETGEIDVALLNALGFGAVVAISNDVNGADLAKSEMAKHETAGVTERPAGMPLDVNVVGPGAKDPRPLGYVILGPGELKAIQKQLKEQKYFLGDANGTVSVEFMAALRTFQLAKNINATGLIDLPTLAWFPDVIKVVLAK